MTPALLGTLAVLALADSTSTGTLVLPVWLLLAAGRLRVGRYLGYLLTVALGYLALGLVLALGARVALVELIDSLTLPGGWEVGLRVGQVAIGAALLWWSHVLAEQAKEPGRGPVARALRWRDRVMTEEGSWTTLVVVGLSVVAIEAVMMLPYLAAIGALTAARPSLPVLVLTLTAYCTVMVLPALALLGVRVALGSRIEGTLRRLGAWLERTVSEATSWIAGIAGVLIGLSGLRALL